MYRRIFFGNTLSAIASAVLLPTTALATPYETEDVKAKKKKHHGHQGKKSKHYDTTEKLTDAQTDSVATIAEKDHKHHSKKPKHHRHKEKSAVVNPPEVSTTEII
ncbi:hypothetical protein [Calothrix sp. PCC 7507]|uniref:hypothetical protein n=1 Tax=Calothrix sp. PCC 7507 TaxID=99598 RepID=UPI00029F19F4|nr:hypothetical protein [Calothrix sp. PCC 7507]AFY35196.1 hypothetical protein Cal7507_4842 [Calothrix sp. PCC 7507]